MLMLFEDEEVQDRRVKLMNFAKARIAKQT